MKKLLKLTLTLLMVSTLFACGNKNEEPNGTKEINSESQVSEEASSMEEMTISHSKGEATVKINPKKVVVFDLAVLDTMEKLGIDAEIAYPLDSKQSYLKGFENAINAGGLKEPNLEAIHSFKPDIIFINNRQEKFYEDLNEIAPTVYVDLNYETYLDDFKRNVTTIGKLFNKEDLALEELNKIDEKIKEANEKTKDLEEKALILLTSGGKIKAYGNKSRFGIIYDALGFKEADENMYKEGEKRDTHGKEVSFEYVLDVNPDILFIVDRDAVVGGEKDALATINNDLVNNTNAVKNEKVVFLSPEAWYLAGGGLQSVNIMIDEAMSILK